MVSSVVTSKAVNAGEELYTYYGYENNVYGKSFPMAGHVPWYWELKRKTEKDERMQKSNFHRTT